jgi:hypothetical protein
MEPAGRIQRMGPLGATPETPFNLSRSSPTADAHGSRCFGVHEQVEEGNPNGMFNGQRSGFGLTGGRLLALGEEDVLTTRRLRSDGATRLKGWSGAQT